MKKATRDSGTRFWACFAVVMALFTQILFPPQVMATQTAQGIRLVLCTPGMDSQPIVDTVVVKSKSKAPGLAGLKCAQCVLASVTAITTPRPVFEPAFYAMSATAFTPSAITAPAGARAPPRPHSCGPPAQI